MNENRYSGRVIRRAFDTEEEERRNSVNSRSEREEGVEQRNFGRNEVERSYLVGSQNARISEERTIRRSYDSSENRYEEASSSRASLYANIDETTPSGKALIAFVRSLYGHSGNSLLGLFGINSDNIAREIISEARNIYAGNIVELPMAHIMRGDVHLTLLGSMMAYFKQVVKPDRYSAGDRRSLLIELKTIANGQEFNEPLVTRQYASYSLDGEERFGSYIAPRDDLMGYQQDVINRGQNCKTVLQHLRNLLRFERTTKMVWHIDFGMEPCDNKMLSHLYELASEDFIIIANFFPSSQSVAESIGYRTAYRQGEGMARLMGGQILSKYFNFDNKIDTDVETRSNRDEDYQ